MPSTSPGICVECGKAFPSDELVFINHSWVCAQCKPILLQRLIEGVALPGCNFWRLDKKLVARINAPFPDRCVKCNAPANGFRLQRDFIFVLGAHKRAVIQIGLCKKHRAQHKLGVIIGWSSVALGLILFFGGAAISSGITALCGMAVLIVFGLIAAVLSTTVTPTKITVEEILISGVHRDFLDDLPEWPGPT
jgi:hypothetical protein